MSTCDVEIREAIFEELAKQGEQARHEERLQKLRGR
jgi:hypothetical protein